MFRSNANYPLPHRRRLSTLARFLVPGALILTLFYLISATISREHNQLRVQHDFSKRTPESMLQTDRLQSVKNEFLHAWSGYKNQSWMSDSLKPITGGKENGLCGWAATLIDSLDTLYIMDLHDEFELATQAVVNIDFRETAQDCQVNFFESTIRYLGGLLAAYDLSMDPRLKLKAIEIGEILHLAFDTTTGMPCGHCQIKDDPSKAVLVPDHDAPLADTFSFSLEFLRLWQITGQTKYLDKVLFISTLFFESQNKSSLPGLWPERVDATNVNGSDSRFVTLSTAYSLGALSDSAYEYLVKTYLLLQGSDERYELMWSAASKQIKEHMLFRAQIPVYDGIDTLFAGIVKTNKHSDVPLLEPRIEHLNCFAGGMFALSSQVFGDPGDLEIGRALTEGCVWAYNNTRTGIMPETVTLTQCPGEDDQQCSWNESTWQDAPGRIHQYPAGYISSLNTQYGLRPEAIESIFVMYRLTGEERWREVGWNMFTNIIKQTRTQYGHAALVDVIDAPVINGTMVAKQKDQMESFWLAETLKYFYLLFSDPHLVSLDDYVLNTEAHPLRLDKRRRFIH